jgi:hypothetical protein
VNCEWDFSGRGVCQSLSMDCKTAYQKTVCDRSTSCVWVDDIGRCDEVKCSVHLTRERCNRESKTEIKKCKWVNYIDGCEEIRCGDLGTSWNCSRSRLERGFSCVWVSNVFCVDYYSSCSKIFDPITCGLFNDNSSNGLNLTCVWVESSSFSGCVDIKVSCESVLERDACVTVPDCKWDGKCLAVNSAKSSNSNSSWIIVMVVGFSLVVVCGIYL